MRTAFRQKNLIVFLSSATCAAGLLAEPDHHSQMPGRPGPSPEVMHKSRFTPGHHIDRVPTGAISILLDGTRFFFHAGLFYEWQSGGYVIIDAPFGAIVPVLPLGCSVQIVNGETYYVLNGGYYRRVSGGYMVVHKPVPNVVVVDRTPVTPKTVTVWVQNPNGSRTPVELTPSVDGQWIGPKGEYYPMFPSEAQLRPVYGVPGTIDPSAMISQPKTQTLWIENMNGSKTPVELQQLADGTWKGPNGEIYSTLPTEEDLRSAYGLAAQ